jgi:hypothetical protein
MYEQIVGQSIEGDAFNSILAYFSEGNEPADAFFLKISGLTACTDDLNAKINRWLITQELPWRIQSWHWDSADAMHVFLFRGVDVSEVFALNSEPL